MNLLSSDQALDMCAELDKLLTRELNDTRPDEVEEPRSKALWQRLVSDGWIEIGLSAGLGVRDLIDIAIVWGRHCVSLPFMPSMLVARWYGDTHPNAAGAATYALPEFRTKGYLAPFGAVPGIVCVGGVDGQLRIDLFRETVDQFATSLPLTQAAAGSDLCDSHLQEVALFGAAEAIGAAARVLEKSVNYASQREQYGKKIGAYQGVSHRLVNMHRDVELGKSALTWGSQEPTNSLRAAAYALEVAQTVGESAIQVHGGMGYTWESGIHLYLRHILQWKKLLPRAIGAKDSTGAP
jgi:Acyl-CoA dehydrogenase, C-terminal domain